MVCFLIDFRICLFQITQMRLPSLVICLTLRHSWSEFSLAHLLKRVLLDEGDECRKWLAGHLIDMKQVSSHNTSSEEKISRLNDSSL